MSFEHERTTEDQDSSLYQITDSFLERIRTAPSGLPETYGATPLNHGAAYNQQLTLRMALAELLEDEIPSDIPGEVVEYMKDAFMIRFMSRGTANHENYLSALKPREELSNNPFLQDMITRAELGHASPGELLVVRQLMGIRSVELACLTHPYGKKIEYLKEMRTAVRDNVELLGGEYFDEPKTRYRVKGFVGDRHDYTHGLLMTRKRTIGKMSDGTLIRERSSFVLRLDDESILPKSVIAEIIEAVKKLSRKSTDWQDEIVRAGRLDEISELLLNSNEFSLAIPISTTIYAFNAETAQLVKEHALEEKAKAIEADSQISPFLAALMAERKARIEESTRPTINVGDMLYVGREGENVEDVYGDSALKPKQNNPETKEY